MICFILAISFGLFSEVVFSGSMGRENQETGWTWVDTLSLGPVWGTSGETQTFYLTPTIEKTYSANKSNNVLFYGEFFAGLQKNLSQTVIGQLGLAVAASGDATALGVIWDDADPEFDNYTYSYKIQHTHLAVKGKLLKDMGFWVMPWIGGSLGIGFNKDYSFINIPTIFEAIPNPNFTSHTQTAFTYTLSIGMQMALDMNWQVGAGYEFADWGKNRLGRAQEQTLNTGIALNHFYTNGLMFNLTYIA